MVVWVANSIARATSWQPTRQPRECGRCPVSPPCMNQDPSTQKEIDAIVYMKDEAKEYHDTTPGIHHRTHYAKEDVRF